MTTSPGPSPRKVAAEPVTLAARDGHPLAATWYRPKEGEPERAIVVACAMAVRRGFYEPYARFLASRGASVVVTAAGHKLTATEEATDVNPLRQSLEAELAKAQLNATGLRARTASLRRQIDDYRSSLGLLQSSTAEDDKLLREIKEAEENFFLYSKKREEARIGEAMDRQKIANVVLVEPPHVPPIPRPKITGAFMAAYVFYCMLILAYALLLGTAQNKVYTPWELEGITGLPVLASVSYRRLPMAPRSIGRRVPTRP